MILVAFALARPGPELGEELVPAWVTDEWRPLEVSRSDCRATPQEDGPILPAGLPVEARIAYSECGREWAYVRTPIELGTHRTKFFHVPLAGVSLEPPRRNTHDGDAATGSAFLFATSSPGYALGVSVDPEHPEPVLLPKGAQVQVLDPDVALIRTAWGSEAVVTPWLLRDADPIAEERSEERRVLARRVIAGMSAHAPVAPLPSSEALLADRALDGRTWLVEIRREDLTADREISAEWLDPVGQGLSHTCDSDRDGTLSSPKPCGSYFLDFSPFGAWWMTDPSTELFVVSDGTVERGGRRLPRLTVVVRAPFSAHPAVSPAWDGIDPGAAH